MALQGAWISKYPNFRYSETLLLLLLGVFRVDAVVTVISLLLILL